MGHPLAVAAESVRRQHPRKHCEQTVTSPVIQAAQLSLAFYDTIRVK